MLLFRGFLCLATIFCGVHSLRIKNLDSFIHHELVPDILSQPPASLMSVKFPSGVEALEGNELTSEEVQGIPDLSWGSEDGVFYTVVMCDADPPSRANPADRSFLHWLVVNAMSDDVTTGDTLVDILNSHPEPSTGLHRYVMLVYRQQMALVAEGSMPNSTFEGRVKFSPEDFAAKYNLGDPIAGNFYQTQTIE